ncbi:MAG: hypothetical protein Kow0070_26560 [Anaerolineales bacterium]
MLRQNKSLLWLIALVLITACAPVLSASPAVPTLDRAAIQTIVAQTAAAASTQTAEAAAVLPPVNTPTPPPTITSTFILAFNSPTAVTLPLVTATSKPANSRDYACRVLKSPPNETTYAPRTDFIAVWLLQNTGRKIWDSESVLFAYDFGDRFHKTAAYNLKKTAEYGDMAEFSVEMLAPKDPGRYTTHWALQTSTEKFCEVSLTIIVKE